MLDLAGTWLTPEDRQLLRQPEVGGMILFARNTESPAQVRELVRSIRAVRPDMLIAIDQEGGRVQRLRRDVLRLPALGRIAGCAAAEQEQLAEAAAWLMATEMLACGIDISFAPVLDLDYGRSQVIGDRSLGGDPQQVSRLGQAYIQGLRQAGMAATGKHFPGHGWAEADSHFDLPVDERSEATIRESDLQPFAALAPLLDGIMPAHVVYPAVDSLPAGFSRRWLQDILRAELGFRGVIFSDDLTMAGAHAVGGMAERVDAALASGCDMLLVCNDRAAAEQALAHAQQMGMQPSPRAQGMLARSTPGIDYKAQPRWRQAVELLQGAGLL
ncbi:beta-N-acetylhexosaminidase [Pseudomonas sp. G11-1]|uniref:beta-N-acetylhexosaminidase n=1 Tax=Halopseudomonas sp. SMJS2 TaxID=3041098 RepID=UPI002452F03B|nr:beta-N-acetylhexosaminidase [Halopseudomonas sp. SMJS2]MCO5787498.1 beta-N-acetylhexosaminidase [Pseudomonas sp. G11-1]MCO5790771.1 beta-N-acetylhexosaminidase [Pseudomonas sp. G11-2]WGK63265.1 beta-N-acetylhexosaminidase [Halopseudomonas sp. SMJS2]